MNNKTFPRLACAFMMCFTFFLLPFNDVYADGYRKDSDFWRWWYIEHTTDDITNGSGASAENIENTDSGQTAGTVIYNQSGVTRGDFIDYVEEQYNTAEGYIQKGVDYYVDAVNHVYDSTVTTATKAAYQTEKAVREVVDSTGKVIVDVSGSDFWHSAYNSLFNNNGYNEQYIPSENESYTGEVNGHTFSVNWFGVCSVPANANIENPASDVVYIPSDCRFASSLNHLPDSEFWGNTVGLSFTVDGNQYYEYRSTQFQGWFGGFDGISITGNTYRFNFHWTGRSGTSYNDSITIYFTNTPTNQGTQNTPILQPKQVGFIIYNGDRIPVYTDPSQNPYTVNDDGTVDYNGNTYPIYVDTDEISPDGWLKILEFIDNEDQTQNPYNPQGQPWNTQPDGTVLGGFFSSLISDIGNLFSSLGDTIKSLLNGLIDMIKGIFIPTDFDFSQLFDFEIEDNFGLIQQIIEYFLQAVGVTST